MKKRRKSISLRWYLFKGGLRRRYRRWRRIDRRKKSWGNYKWAINRDGDLFLTECPKCHSQNVSLNEKTKHFYCRKCDVIFEVYKEDGAVRIMDHRKGDVDFPAVAVWDKPCKVYRLGIRQDAPWWWESRAVLQDLHNGKDAHGHEKYKVVGSQPRESEIDTRPEVEQGESI